ncbi:MAG: LpxD N-terminal domain-containing protein, partial [Nitrospinota bacterium]
MNAPASPRPLRLSEIAERLGGTLEGDPDLIIRGVADWAEAGPEEIVFLSDPRRVRELEACRAGAVVAGGPWEVGRPAVRVRDARRALAELARHFHPPRHPPPGVHESAHVGRNVRL